MLQESESSSPNKELETNIETGENKNIEIIKENQNKVEEIKPILKETPKQNDEPEFQSTTQTPIVTPIQVEKLGNSSVNTTADTDKSSSSFFTDKSNVVVVHEKNQSESLCNTFIRYVKCFVLALLVVLFGSVFVNLYQTFLGDCEDLEAEVSKLKDLNEDLHEIVNTLTQQNTAIKQEVDTFNQTSISLSNSIRNISLINEEYKVIISSIEQLSIDLETVLSDQTLTFEQFKDELELSTELFSIENTNLETSLNSLKSDVINLSSVLETSTNTKNTLMNNYLNFITQENIDFVQGRAFALTIFASQINDLDDNESLSESEYDEVLTRASDILYDETINLLDNNPFEQPLTLEEMLDLIETLSEVSFQQTPNLFVTNQFS